MRHQVIFRHPAEFVPLSEDEGILGTNGAAWFVSILRGIPDLEIDEELVQEDWGVVVFVVRSERKFWIGISFLDESEWRAHVHHGVFSWFQHFTPSGRAAFRRLVVDLHEALARTPEVSAIAWCTQREVDSPPPRGVATPQ